MTVTEFPNKLTAAQRENKTGSFFIQFPDSIALLSIKLGEICYLQFRGKRGNEALQALSSELGAIAPVKVQFNEGAVTQTTAADLPPTLDIITTLQEVAEPQPENRKTTVFLSDTAEAGSSAMAHTGERVQSAPALDQQQIKNIVVDLVGPMGSVICAEVFASTDDPQTALRLLEDNLAALGFDQQFLAKINTA